MYPAVERRSKSENAAILQCVQDDDGEKRVTWVHPGFA
jgi:hypothetical protein